MSNIQLCMDNMHIIYIRLCFWMRFWSYDQRSDLVHFGHLCGHTGFAIAVDVLSCYLKKKSYATWFTRKLLLSQHTWTSGSTKHKSWLFYNPMWDLSRHSVAIITQIHNYQERAQPPTYKPVLWDSCLEPKQRFSVLLLTNPPKAFRIQTQHKHKQRNFTVVIPEPGRQISGTIMASFIL